MHCHSATMLASKKIDDEDEQNREPQPSRPGFASPPAYFIIDSGFIGRPAERKHRSTWAVCVAEGCRILASS